MSSLGTRHDGSREIALFKVVKIPRSKRTKAQILINPLLPAGVAVARFRISFEVTAFSAADTDVLVVQVLRVVAVIARTVRAAIIVTVVVPQSWSAAVEAECALTHTMHGISIPKVGRSRLYSHSRGRLGLSPNGGKRLLERLLSCHLQSCHALVPTPFTVFGLPMTPLSQSAGRWCVGYVGNEVRDAAKKDGASRARLPYHAKTTRAVRVVEEGATTGQSRDKACSES